MKELKSYNRVAGYLNKIFDLLNAEFLDNALSRPITIQLYGQFALRDDTWVSKLGGTHEINIGEGTQVDTCLFHAPPSVIAGNTAPQAVLRQL